MHAGLDPERGGKVAKIMDGTLRLHRLDDNAQSFLK
jgi:hypothetical protein